MSSDNNNEPRPPDEEDGTKKRRKRVVPPLPEELASLTEKDLDKFQIAKEKDPGKGKNNKTYGEEFFCAQSITFPGDEEEEGLSPPRIIYLVKHGNQKGMILDHLRKIAQNVGCKNVGGLTHYQCRKQIAVLKSYAEGLAAVGMTPSSIEARKTNTLCRAINIVFSSSFFERFLKLNDIKNRVDHESGTTVKQFWIDASDAHNAATEDDDFEVDDLYLGSEMDNHILDLSIDESTNLKQVDGLTPIVFKQRIMSLFKIRRRMKENMHLSGEHGPPWDYVQAALKEGSGINKISAYYFYLRCEVYPELDQAFCPFMDKELKGSTEDLENVNEEGNRTNQPPAKKQALMFMEKSSDDTEELLKCFKESQQKKIELMEKKQKDMDEQRKIKTLMTIMELQNAAQNAPNETMRNFYNQQMQDLMNVMQLN